MKAEEIIKEAEKEVKGSEYYQEMLESGTGNPLAFKYGAVTMNLAMQIRSLKKQLQ